MSNCGIRHIYQNQTEAKCNNFRTPQGADYIECPNCYTYLEDIGGVTEWDTNVENQINEQLQDPSKDSLLIQLNDESDEYLMCLCCKYIFDFSHTYQENGCTDSDYFYVFPCEFVASVNATEISNIEELKEFIQSFKVKKIRCSCNGEIGGDRAAYPRITHPLYYCTSCKVEWTKQINQD